MSYLERFTAKTVVQIQSIMQESWCLSKTTSLLNLYHHHHILYFSVQSERCLLPHLFGRFRCPNRLIILITVSGLGNGMTIKNGYPTGLVFHMQAMNVHCYLIVVVWSHAQADENVIKPGFAAANYASVNKVAQTIYMKHKVTSIISCCRALIYVRFYRIFVSHSGFFIFGN